MNKGGWVALRFDDSFDPIFDLIHQWTERKYAVDQGQNHLEDYHGAVIDEFWVAQVHHTDPAKDKDGRVAQVFLRNLEKITRLL